MGGRVDDTNIKTIRWLLARNEMLLKSRILQFLKFLGVLWGQRYQNKIYICNYKLMNWKSNFHGQEWKCPVNITWRWSPDFLEEVAVLRWNILDSKMLRQWYSLANLFPAVPHFFIGKVKDFPAVTFKHYFEKLQSSQLSIPWDAKFCQWYILLHIKVNILVLH